MNPTPTPTRPAEALDASTVIVLRERAHRLEVLCVRRNPNLAAWGGALAFPGGKVEPHDASPDPRGLDSPPNPRCRAFGDPPGAERAFTVAAARECLEEVCILPTVDANVDHATALRLRASLDGGRSFRQVLGDSGIGLDLAAFVPLAHWITPLALPRRFDARFYVLALPAGQTGAADGTEATASHWMEPTEIEDRFERGDVQLAAPTLWMVNMLREQRSISKVMDFASRQSLQPILPELVQHGDDLVLAMPGFPGHSVATPRLQGPRSFVQRRNRFVLNREI